MDRIKCQSRQSGFVKTIVSYKWFLRKGFYMNDKVTVSGVVRQVISELLESVGGDWEKLPTPKEIAEKAQEVVRTNEGKADAVVTVNQVYSQVSKLKGGNARSFTVDELRAILDNTSVLNEKQVKNLQEAKELGLITKSQLKQLEDNAELSQVRETLLSFARR